MISTATNRSAIFALTFFKAGSLYAFHKKLLGIFITKGESH